MFSSRCVKKGVFLERHPNPSHIVLGHDVVSCTCVYRTPTKWISRKTPPGGPACSRCSPRTWTRETMVKSGSSCRKTSPGSPSTPTRWVPIFYSTMLRKEKFEEELYSSLYRFYFYFRLVRVWFLRIVEYLEIEAFYLYDNSLNLEIDKWPKGT